MSHILESARLLEKQHEGFFIRLDGNNREGWLQESARKKNCYRIHRVWSDGINIRKYGTNPNTRPAFLSLARLNQRVELYTAEEFVKLPE